MDDVGVRIPSINYSYVGHGELTPTYGLKVIVITILNDIDDKEQPK